MAIYRINQLEKCNRQMFGDLILTCPMPVSGEIPEKLIQPIPYIVGIRRFSGESVVNKSMDSEQRRASALVDELLVDIYNNIQNSNTTDYNSATSGKSHKSRVEIVDLHGKDILELISITNCLKAYVERMGSVLVRQLKRRDALRRQQDSHSDVITRLLLKRSAESADMRFTIHPVPGESGFSQWVAAMKMVAQLPGGIPPEFRRTLWLNLADRHLASRKVDWSRAERSCFSEWSHPTDAELGVQIVKDLHRTGCSLFCGEDGVENQALLKRVLLAYARWNKAVGYCQGFNMLAALILQVTDKNESEALKLMIYLIEGVLPDSYFADSLRGLSVDMAVFRELLKTRLPRLSRHLDTLQNAAKDGTTSYEPPLTNVFTMQWFLTLFCNCLPQPTVLRVWDLILLEGNEILLRTALAIWQTLADKISSVRSADEFYCIMGVLTRELLEFGLVDANSLIKAVVTIGPLTELKSLRDHYLYNINPWGPSLSQAVVNRQLKLYPKERLVLDISALKKQYVKLKQRQRQAHIIFSAAISRQPPSSTPVAMNHLLLGKSALVTTKRLGPPKGSIPPARHPPSTLHWKDAKQTSSSSSSDTELCDEGEESSSEEEEQNICQFEDNLPAASDTNLMKNDNITSAKDSASENLNLLDFDSTPCQTVNPIANLELCDNFDTNSTAEKTLLAPESDEDNYEFEEFLADRVGCLKSPVAEPPEIEDKRVNFARRNSELALQIIQENSLILHRILQCQSRLSPSPPLDYNSECITSDDRNSTSPEICTTSHLLDEYASHGLNFRDDSVEIDKACEIHNWIDDVHEHNIRDSVSIQQIQSKFDFKLDSCDINDLQSPEYGSKYTSILEKSKSLDERYNSLILNSNLLKGNRNEDSIMDLTVSDDKELTQSKDLTVASPVGYSVVSEEQSNNLNITSSPTYKFKIDEISTENICKTTSKELKEITPKNSDENEFMYSGTLEPSESGFCSSTNTYSFTPSLIDLEENKSLNLNSNSHLLLQMKDIHLPISEESITQTKSTLKSPDSENDFLSELSSSKTCYNYLNSPVTEKNSKCPVNSQNDLYDSEMFLTSTKELPARSDLLDSPKDSPEHSTKLNDFKYTEHEKSSTLDLETQSLGESSSLKSPSKIFNPFPVSLSSRQNKEIPLKLGLYKK